MTTEELGRRHAESWRAATRHPFLDGVRDGTLARGAFATWLGQDRLFVEDLLRFQAGLLARSPRHAQAVLAGGLVALEAELTWFEEQAAARSLELTETRHSTTAAYRDHFAALGGASFGAAITSLWALERIYLDAWRSARPGADIYRPFVEHWTTGDFEAYVAALAVSADCALTRVDGTDVEPTFSVTLHLERRFWDMALGQ